jgi:uncharacterized protein YggE
MPRTVSVTGEAEVRVVPDEVSYNFGIETSNKDIEEGRRENDKRVKDLIELTKRLGIAPEHVQTDYMSIDPDYVETEARYGEPRGGRKLVGYVTRRNIVVTLKDLTKVEELVAEALKLGVNSVDQGEFRTADLRKYRDQARLNATKAAQEKATALAGQLGAKVGKPLSISEEGIWDYPWMSSSYGRRNRMMTQNSISDMGGGPGPAGTVAPGQITVVARVNVTFELE